MKRSNCDGDLKVEMGFWLRKCLWHD